MRHTCHARRCETPVPPRLFMCRRHWFMVPEPLRAEIKAEYRPPQCKTKRPSRAWVTAAIAAVRAVDEREHGTERGRDGPSQPATRGRPRRDTGANAT